MWESSNCLWYSWFAEIVWRNLHIYGSMWYGSWKVFERVTLKSRLPFDRSNERNY